MRGSNVRMLSCIRIARQSDDQPSEKIAVGGSGCFAVIAVAHSNDGKDIVEEVNAIKDSGRRSCRWESGALSLQVAQRGSSDCVDIMEQRGITDPLHLIRRQTNSGRNLSRRRSRPLGMSNPSHVLTFSSFNKHLDRRAIELANILQHRVGLPHEQQKGHDWNQAPSPHPPEGNQQEDRSRPLSDEKRRLHTQVASE